MTYEFLEHTADVKFRAVGRTLGEAFDFAVLAFARFIGGGLKIKADEERVVRVSGEDVKEVLYTFLDELVYLFDAEGFVVVKSAVSVSEDGTELEARLWGSRASEYSGLKHIKAATYSDMVVKNVGDEWVIEAVVDV